MRRAPTQICLLGAALVLLASCRPSDTHPDGAAADPSPSSGETKSAARPAHWGYEPPHGPARWAKLSPAYALCAEGREQSPIDLGGAEIADSLPLVRDYRPVTIRIIRHEQVVDIVDNGHTIQVDYEEGSVLMLGEEAYSLAQYHFHASSEHTVDGRRYPMEMHLVHRSASGQFAVAGVLIEEGAHNPAFEPVWDHMPHEVGKVVHLERVEVDMDDLLPNGRSIYRYRGSLTTPPCSEGVIWLIAAETIELSRAQIDRFTSIIPANNRPLQPLGERRVTISGIDE